MEMVWVNGRIEKSGGEQEKVYGDRIWVRVNGMIEKGEWAKVNGNGMAI